MAKREVVTLSLSAEDKELLQDLAAKHGYKGNLSAFVRAIANRDIPVGDEPKKRIDLLVDRVNELSAQRDRDWDAIIQMITRLSPTDLP